MSTITDAAAKAILGPQWKAKVKGTKIVVRKTAPLSAQPRKGPKRAPRVPARTTPVPQRPTIPPRRLVMEMNRTELRMLNLLLAAKESLRLADRWASLLGEAKVGDHINESSRTRLRQAITLMEEVL